MEFFRINGNGDLNEGHSGFWFGEKFPPKIYQKTAAVLIVLLSGNLGHSLDERPDVDFKKRGITGGTLILIRP